MMRTIRRFAIGCLLGLICVNGAMAQTAEITYQGKLVENSQPANASYDFEFRLYDASTAGTLLDTRTRSAVAVTNGIFTVQLDFPPALFDGANRYLEIFVRPAGSGGGYQQLLPRQPLTSAPYALRALTATNADNATNATNATNAANAAQLGGVAASQYVLTTDPRMTDARNPLPNSTNYVQNTTVQQAASNFNISGNGTAGGTLSGNIINATTQYNLGDNRILGNAGFANLFAGIGAGAANTTGQNNSFYGRNAGLSNTTGGNNSFFGSSSGASNTTGNQNAFFGDFAGISNTNGSRNAFFGYRAGQQSTTSEENAFFGYNAGMATTGSFNSFFGASAGAANTTGNSNAFFGRSAGAANTTGFGNSFFGADTSKSNTEGDANSFFGDRAGRLNTTGLDNSFFGYAAGESTTSGGANVFFGSFTGNSNTTGSSNTLVGDNSDVGSGNLNFATAIGAGSLVNTSNTIALGRDTGTDKVVVYGLGAAGSTSLCRNASNQISTCSSSLRYKTDVQPFHRGLDVVRKLRPINFKWRHGGMRDVGFAAEEVEPVEPLLVTYNDKDEIEGVKYGQLTTVLVNAIKEQQVQLEMQQQQTTKLQDQVQKQNGQIEQQQKRIQSQQNLINGLRKLVCQQTRKPKSVRNDSQ